MSYVLTGRLRKLFLRRQYANVTFWTLLIAKLEATVARGVPDGSQNQGGKRLPCACRMT